jgi:hypothetical protein
MRLPHLKVLGYPVDSLAWPAGQLWTPWSPRAARKDIADLHARISSPQEHSDFIIGRSFWCAGPIWRCTDIGIRTIIAIRIDSAVGKGSRKGKC